MTQFSYAKVYSSRRKGYRYYWSYWDGWKMHLGAAKTEKQAERQAEKVGYKRRRRAHDQNHIHTA